MDADGYFYLVDRLKEVIVTGGYKVYPRRVEEAIHRHPAVAEVTVVGITDDYRGEVPKAFVRLKDGESLTLETLGAFRSEEQKSDLQLLMGSSYAGFCLKNIK